MHAVTIGLAAAMTFALAQEKPPEAVPKRGDVVTVRGCISGSTISSSDIEVRDSTGKYSTFVTFRLTGNKKVVNPIKKEHDGHVDVLVGTLKSDLPETNAPHGKRIGKTRIIIGVGQQSGRDSQRYEPMPALDVTAIEHTGVTCRT